MRNSVSYYKSKAEKYKEDRKPLAQKKLDNGKSLLFRCGSFDLVIESNREPIVVNKDFFKGVDNKDILAMVNQLDSMGLYEQADKLKDMINDRKAE